MQPVVINFSFVALAQGSMAKKISPRECQSVRCQHFLLGVLNDFFTGSVSNAVTFGGPWGLGFQNVNWVGAQPSPHQPLISREPVSKVPDPSAVIKALWNAGNWNPLKPGQVKGAFTEEWRDVISWHRTWNPAILPSPRAGNMAAILISLSLSLLLIFHSTSHGMTKWLMPSSYNLLSLNNFTL